MAKSSDDGAKAKSKLPKIIVGVVIVAVGYKFFLAPKKDATASAAAKSGVEAEVKEGEVMALPELTVNLADKDKSRYLRVGIALILEAGTSTEHMKNEAPIASDVAVDVLSARTYDELHAPGAKQAVKEELSKKVREAYHDGKVARVIFSSFVMQ